MGIFMFKISHELLPPMFQNIFHLNNTVHNYCTRHSENYHLYRVNTDVSNQKAKRLSDSLPYNILLQT
ncbi:hypothetical protein HOLleu_22513 [Holothuria leucospilota]|uniref:Uncharacterized protein n=1 Tax=Holothuria leucospilota TaxID=206669 RepID=A0A9Q1BYP7_HOLLE|nr:hypothetical protein HOLleu_22513 [Holothuria leucospilota]